MAKKISLKLVFKKNLSPYTYLLIFSGKNLDFKPGQFANLELQTGLWRSYSIVSVDQKQPFFLTQKEELLPDLGSDEVYYSFLVSTRNQGAGSLWVEAISLEKDDAEDILKIPAILPIGNFQLSEETELTKNFICTGTGLAPIVSMLSFLQEISSKVIIRLFCGTDRPSLSYIKQFLPKTLENFELLVCMRDDVDYPTLTQAIDQKIENFTKEEFYLCGNPNVVQDLNLMLKEKGAIHVRQEQFIAKK